MEDLKKLLKCNSWRVLLAGTRVLWNFYEINTYYTNIIQTNFYEMPGKISDQEGFFLIICGAWSDATLPVPNLLLHLTSQLAETMWPHFFLPYRNQKSSCLEIPKNIESNFVETKGELLYSRFRLKVEKIKNTIF